MQANRITTAAIPSSFHDVEMPAAATGSANLRIGIFPPRSGHSDWRLRALGMPIEDHAKGGRAIGAPSEAVPVPIQRHKNSPHFSQATIEVMSNK